jgi:integrase/recombinase XerD
VSGSQRRLGHDRRGRDAGAAALAAPGRDHPDRVGGRGTDSGVLAGQFAARSIDRRQAAGLLASCDRRTAIGRRDHAVLVLLLRLGLRVGEVAALELADVDWRHGEIQVRGKGGHTERLPLPVDVGQAVAGWLRHGRPSCASRRVFTTLLAPRRELSRKGVSAIVHRAACRCDLAVTAHGLRHSAATELLRAGGSLPEVGQVLRHASMLSTAIYAKVDHAALPAVAQPWPGAR